MSRLLNLGAKNACQIRQFCARMTNEKSINSAQVLGRVGANPQMRGTEEHPVVIFSVATHTNYRFESGEFQQKTDWHRVCVFKPSLRDMIMNYLRKGQRVLVNGRLMYGSITTEDGNMKNTVSIVADDVVFFSSSATQSNAEATSDSI